jgi:predicted lysophospholipase L1 biosynthesis ABC-type transport system permease subunit
VLWVVVGIFWVAFLVGFYLVCKPRFETIERQREVVGNREIPRPAKRLIAALICVAAIAPLAVTIAVGLGAAGVLAGSIVLAASMSAIMAVSLRAARVAQARRPGD